MTTTTTQELIELRKLAEATTPSTRPVQAATPAKVIELLDTIQALQEDLERLRGNFGALYRMSERVLAERDQLQAEVDQLKADAAHIKGIMRTNPDLLEIRMSLDDFHCKKVIGKNEYKNAKDAKQLISHAAVEMFFSIDAAKGNV